MRKDALFDICIKMDVCSAALFLLYAAIKAVLWLLGMCGPPELVMDIGHAAAAMVFAAGAAIEAVSIILAILDEFVDIRIPKKTRYGQFVEDSEKKSRRHKNI